MFSKFKNLLNTGVEAILADRTIPISEEVINSALTNYAKGIPELSSLSLDIQDGSFELVAEGKKLLTFKSRTRFEIAACEISAEKQVVTFRRLTPTELSADKLIDRILITVFKAIACGIFNVEPAKLALQGMPGVTVNGDSYTVDLSQAKISGNVIKGALGVAGSMMKVKELKCAPKKFQVLIGKK